MEDAHPEGAQQELRRRIRAASAPVQAAVGGGRNCCGRSGRLVRREFAGRAVPAGEGAKVLLGAWIWPEAGDVEEGVGPDWRERRDLVGSHGRMLLAGGAPAPEQAS